MNKKELVVSAIENGTVIDHIPADKLFQVVRALDLTNSTDQILMGNIKCALLNVLKGVKQLSMCFRLFHCQKLTRGGYQYPYLLLMR